MSMVALAEVVSFPSVEERADRQIEQCQAQLRANSKQCDALKRQIAIAKANRIALDQSISDMEEELETLSGKDLDLTETIQDLNFKQGPAWEALHARSM